MNELERKAQQFPTFTADPVDRLRHTLAAYADAEDDRRVVTATAGVQGMPDWTGLTWGDLRALLAKLDGDTGEMIAVGFDTDDGVKYYGVER